MLRTGPNRASRRSDRRRTAKKILAGAGATIATAALTAGVSAPAANAAVYNPDITLAADTIEIPVITSGPLMGVAQALGFSTISLPLGDTLGNYNLNLTYQSGQANVYTAVNNASSMQEAESLGFLFCGVLSGEKGGSCRAIPMVSAGFGALGAVGAIEDLGLSAEGNTPWPLADIVGGGLTNSPLIALINPLRPNGGIAARFAPLLDLFGINTDLAPIGVKPTTKPWPPDDAPWTQTAFISDLLDVTWEYNLLSDFPVTLNPFSLLNSVLAAVPPVSQLASLASTPIFDLAEQLPIDFVDGDGVQTACAAGSDDCLGISTADVFITAIPSVLGGSGDFTQVYLTLPAEDLPLLAPLRLPAQLINAVLDRLAAAFAPPGSAGLPFRLGTPIADMLQPALKILVNIGYPDVVTPTDIANNPDLLNQGYCGLGGVCYDRAFRQTATPTPFGSVSPLTPQEWLQVPGDVLGALVTGITQQLSKPFFGIIEPAPCVGCTPTAAVTPPVAATVPAPSAAVAAEAVADPAQTAVAAVAGESAAEAPAAVAVPAAVTEAPAASETRTAPVSKPRAVRAAAAAANADSGKDDTGGSTGRTRAGRGGR